MNKEQLIESLKKSSLYSWTRQTFYETTAKDYNQKLLDGIELEAYYKELLLRDEPCMISRLGSSETKVLKSYHKKKKYPTELRDTLKQTSGVYPTDDEHLDKFARLYIDSIKNIDLLGIWFNPFENVVANEICPNSKITRLRNLEPYFSDRPWSYHLKGKKVLVINPFTNSITRQYENKDLLFKDEGVLPEFNLITYRPVQSFGGKSDHTSWFEALEYMKHEVETIDFDIAIIGAGAYGLPLASFIKEMGRKAFHLGGATQILFGVYGRRWEVMPDFQDVINEHWIKPLEERPKDAEKIENACFW